MQFRKGDVMPEIDEASPFGSATQRDDGGGTGPDVQAKAAEVAEQAQEKAQEAASQLQERLREQLDHRSAQVAEQVNERATHLRSVGESLRQQGNDGAAGAADQLAHYAERVGGYLHEKDSKALLADIEDFGRRQPLAAAAGGLVVGFAASRLLKASSRGRYNGRLTVPQPAGVHPGASPTVDGDSRGFAQSVQRPPTTQAVV
jgi:hypothetical protein